MAPVPVGAGGQSADSPSLNGSSASPSLPTTVTAASSVLHRRNRENLRGCKHDPVAAADCSLGPPAGPPPAPTAGCANDLAVPARCLPCRGRQNETAGSTERTRRARTWACRHVLAVIAAHAPVRARAAVLPLSVGGSACASSKPAPHRRELPQRTPTPGGRTKT